MNALGEYALPLAAYWVSTILPDDSSVLLGVRAVSCLVGALLLSGHLAVLRAIRARDDKTVIHFFPPKRDKRGRAIADADRDAADAVITTVRAYDSGVWWRGLATHALYALGLAATHVLFRATSPLIVAAATLPYAFVDSPLFVIYVAGKPAVGPALTRPFQPRAAVSLLTDARSVSQQWTELQAPGASR